MALSVYIPDNIDIIQETKVDFKQRCIQKPIHVVQYDKTMPIVKVKLEMNGYSYHIPTDMDIYIRWGCPDHTFVVKPVLGKDANHDDIIYFDVDEQMTYFHGQYSPILELRYNLSGGNYKLAGSSPIPFIVDRNPVQEHDIESFAKLVLAQVAFTGSYYDLKDAPGGHSYTPGTYITITDDVIDVDITKIATVAELNQAIYSLGQGITGVANDLSSEVTRATQRETELLGAINTLSGALNSESQTRSQETTALDNRMTTAEGDIDDIGSAVDALESRMDAAEGDIDDINDLIPNAASASNQLADKHFVNSSIQGSTANFRGNWATWSAVPSDYTLYPQDETGNKKPHTSDYIVVVDASGYGDHSKVGTWRFKYSGEWDTAGTSGWNPEYQINDTPMTAAQLAALNSGATAALIAQISTNASNIATLLTDLTSVESRLSTAESNITSHGSRLSTVESGLSAANTNISNLISNGIGYTVESD